MAAKIVMPRLSLTMKTGTVGKWYKKEGETVDKGEPIVEVFSEKATYDLEAPASGILRKIVAAEGVEVPVNEVLGFITGSDEAFSEEALALKETISEEKTKEAVLASPAAKRLARERGVDISLVEGSGPDGRIVEEDIERFLQAASGVLPKIKSTIPLTGFRKVSAERVAASFRTAPHSSLMMEVDASKMVELHDRLQLSYTAIIVKAAAKSLKEHSWINSTLTDGQIKLFEDVNVGVAVATENGLVVPVVRNADEKSVAEIDEAIKELTEKAKQGKLIESDVAGGTFTVTNLGMYEVDFFVPIINPPEAAILGVGRLVEKPVVVNGKIEIRRIIILSLSYDHRIVDGAPAADFLQDVKTRIEKALNLEG
jgi:pyruvate dehydrogenase E2 component (dihydrolipoamide acetyltransferase)